MFVDGPNPTKVQAVPPQKRFRAPTPVVLIHDGGGTTFSYFILGSLERDVWAIHNPKYFDAKVWDGGMDEMARHYIDLMKGSGIKGEVILGGWSLGGFLSLTVARMLADDPSSNISVSGFLIIDSPHHVARSKIDMPLAEAELTNVPDLIQKSFDNCDIMLQDWDLPTWEAPACEGKTLNVAVGGKKFDVPADKSLYKPLDGDWQPINIKKHEHEGRPSKPAAPPPAVMIRCVQPVPKAEDTEYPTLIDIHREKTLLGWEENHADFIKATIDVDADHYSVFDKFDSNKTANLTKKLNEGLEVLDSIRKPEKLAPPPMKPPQMKMDYF